MIALKLAFRNLIGAGLRTWLNVFVLSLAFVVIIWHRGIIDGWDHQAKRDMIAWDVAGGQYWHEAYDPYDPFTIQDSHSPLPTVWQEMIDQDKITPILIAQATIYPDGHMLNVKLSGIDPYQNILKIPTQELEVEGEDIPILLGTRMAKSTQLAKGDLVTIRWRDANGTFDAAEAKIAGIFKTNLPTVDNGQIYVPLERLRQMMQMPNEASIGIKAVNLEEPLPQSGWIFRDQQYLLADINAILEKKRVGGSILYFILMSLSMLAIFDTQVLSIFRRQKEIGTHIALGMTRGQVIQLFTIEGAMHSILAAGVAAIYGIPLLTMQAKNGFAMPASADDYGLAISEKIFPVYSAQLILVTVSLVFITATIVSFLPARKIAKMNPTDAIKGKLQ